ncbi:alanyl-tRNA editing protein [Candidatus Woesearchaeota archaeon]|nr:alanyl-tRNA editing protein [Candidatus Woesearchaeota archaeon]
MSEEALYMDDSYLKEFDATVIGIKDGKHIFLDKTAFYPTGGGQPCDYGSLIRKSDGKRFDVVNVAKMDGKIAHELREPGLQEGDHVHGGIDWERRYKLMRMHTAAHLLSAMCFKMGAKMTGNQLGTDESRIDFDLEQFDKERITQQVAMLNESMKRDAPVKVYYMDREEALKDPEMVKLAKILPPAVERLRIVDIKDMDRQADGGTHVKSTKEVGEIVITKMENKGKSNRRVYFTLK